jgi:arylsulfatase A-like enzyme
MSDARLSRRRFLQAGAAGAAGVAALSAAGCSMEESGAAGRPNMLLVIIDSLRPDHVGAYGSPQVRTPNVDALANRGLRLNRAFPEAMVTIPARRSIFTCRRIFPFRNFVPNPELGQSPGWLPIEDPSRTFTSVLRDEGYWVAQVSDNPHLGFTNAYEPFRKSFDHWTSVLGQSGFYKPPHTVPWREVRRWLPPQLRDDRYLPGMRKYLANTGAGRDEEETCAARVFKTAADLLEEARVKQPFALTVDSFDPHEPWSPPRKYIDMYGDPDYRGPEIGVTEYGFARYFTDEQLRRLHAIYAAEVTMTDRWLGHFMRRFYELGLQKNTVIVLLSDHGYLLGERGYTGKVPSQLHPELAQVPFIIVHPERRAAGEVSTYFASTHDVGPTLLSMAGLDPPRWMEGVDLSPLLAGRKPGQRREYHYGGMYNRFFIRTDDWVLIGDNRGKERTMYDLRLDPHEVNDVVRQHPRLSEELYQTVLEAAGGPLPYYV